MDKTLWPQIIIAVSTLLASLIGYTLAGFNESRRDRRSADREITTRADARREAAADARHAFQRQTLLDLQDAVQLMARHTGRAMHFDRMQARKNQYTQFPEEYDQEMLANGMDVIRLRNRILDPELRAEIEAFEHASTRATLPRLDIKEYDYDGREAAYDDLALTYSESYTRVMQHLGTALREELAWTDDKPTATT